MLGSAPGQKKLLAHIVVKSRTGKSQLLPGELQRNSCNYLPRIIRLCGGVVSQKIRTQSRQIVTVVNCTIFHGIRVKFWWKSKRATRRWIISWQLPVPWAALAPDLPSPFSLTTMMMMIGQYIEDNKDYDNNNYYVNSRFPPGGVGVVVWSKS